jgi:hypothetical protein
VALTKEQYEELPEFVKSDYEQDGETFRHRSEGKLEALKGRMNDLDGKLKSIEEKKAAEIEQAKAEALEQAKTKGEKSEVIKQYEEQMEDLKRRRSETDAQYEERISQLETTIKSSARQGALADLRSKLKVFEDSAPVFDKIVGSMIDVDPATGKRVYLGDDGGATSLDDAGFYAQLDKDPAIARLREAQPSAEGGMANGSNSNRGGAVTGNMGGSRQDRQKAIAAKFPELNKGN